MGHGCEEKGGGRPTRSSYPVGRRRIGFGFEAGKNGAGAAPSQRSEQRSDPRRLNRNRQAAGNCHDETGIRLSDLAVPCGARAPACRRAGRRNATRDAGLLAAFGITASIGGALIGSATTARAQAPKKGGKIRVAGFGSSTPIHSIRPSSPIRPTIAAAPCSTAG